MDSVLSFFTEPLAHSFMQRALLMSVIIAVVCSIFSCFLILKGWSLMGDAISHAILPGLAVAILIGLPIAVGTAVRGPSRSSVETGPRSLDRQKIPRWTQNPLRPARRRLEVLCSSPATTT